MSSKPKPAAATVMPWLRANLDKRYFGALTSTDSRALLAAVQIVELYASTCDRALISEAFRVVVLSMQESTRHFAFHAIAHVMDWGHRAQLWALAGLAKPSPDDPNVLLFPGSRCKYCYEDQERRAA